MVGVTCSKHQRIVSGKIKILQKEQKIPAGKLGFSPLKAVGTDCIHGDEEDFIQLDTKNFKNWNNYDFLIKSLLYELLSDVVRIKDILLIVKNPSATSEIKINNLTIKQKEKWITIGSNDDPGHIHINSEMIKSIKFIEEKKSERTSFSIRFYDQNQDRVFAAFFTKMYDEHNNLDISRKNLYDDLQNKFGSVIQI